MDAKAATPAAMEQDEAAKERPERVPAPLEVTEMATEQAGAATAEAAQAAAKAAAAEEEKQHREMDAMMEDFDAAEGALDEDGAASGEGLAGDEATAKTLFQDDGGIDDEADPCSTHPCVLYAPTLHATRGLHRHGFAARHRGDVGHPGVRPGCGEGSVDLWDPQ